jgi:hypothetical protein
VRSAELAVPKSKPFHGIMPGFDLEGILCTRDVMSFVANVENNIRTAEVFASNSGHTLG